VLAVFAAASVLQAQEAVRQPAPAPGANRQPAASQPAASQAAKAEEQGRVTRIRDLLGLEVVNEAGESYGMIDDMLLNKTSGQIEFVLVAQEENSRELHPLPWRTLTLYRGESPEDQYVILGLPREQFQKAPTITRQQWPTMTVTQWNTLAPEVTAFYRPVRPAEARAVRRAARAARRVLD
jgi:hypothetical protein